MTNNNNFSPTQSYTNKNDDEIIKQKLNIDDINSNTVLRELIYIAFAEPNATSYEDLSSLSPETRRAISEINHKIVSKDKSHSVEHKIKFYSKLTALKLLGDYFGIFGDSNIKAKAELIMNLDNNE